VIKEEFAEEVPFKLKTDYQKYQAKSVVAVHTHNPSYGRGRGRMIMAPGQHREVNKTPSQKQSKTKRLGTQLK
jgi:hypothetical protein